MTWLQEVALENKRNGGLPPISVTPTVNTAVTEAPGVNETVNKSVTLAPSVNESQLREFTLQLRALTTEVALLKAKVALLEGAKDMPPTPSATMDRAAYMRAYRKRSASARNSPVTASDTATQATAADA